MIRIFFLIILLSLDANFAVAQLKSIDELNTAKNHLQQDSSIIKKLIDLHNYVDTTEEGYWPNDFEEAPRIEIDQTYYSADSLLRLFRYSWEECGHYCNTNDNNIVAFREAKGKPYTFIFAHKMRGTIDSVVLLEKGKYLLLSSYGQRARSIESQNCLRASVFSIADSSITWVFNICTSNLVLQDELKDEVHMQFNKRTQILSYRYKFYHYDEPERIYVKSGDWFFSDGRFKTQKETTVYP
jgi:hypothetical protein